MLLFLAGSKTLFCLNTTSKLMRLVKFIIFLILCGKSIIIQCCLFSYFIFVRYLTSDCNKLQRNLTRFLLCMWFTSQCKSHPPYKPHATMLFVQLQQLILKHSQHRLHMRSSNFKCLNCTIKFNLGKVSTLKDWTIDGTGVLYRNS